MIVWRPDLHPRDRRGRFRDVFAKILKMDIGQFMDLGSIVKDAPNIRSTFVWRTKNGWEFRGQTSTGTFSVHVTPESLQGNQHVMEDLLQGLDTPDPFDNFVKCADGCGAPVKGKSTYLPGHDARHKSMLIKNSLAGDQTATQMLQDKGWQKFLDKSVVDPGVKVDTPPANTNFDAPNVAYETQKLDQLNTPDGPAYGHAGQDEDAPADDAPPPFTDEEVEALQQQQEEENFDETYDPIGVDSNLQTGNDAAAKNDQYADVLPYPDLATCNCGCGNPRSPTAKYLPGHDSRHKSSLVSAAKNGDLRAYVTLENKGWLKFLNKDKSLPKANSNVPNKPTAKTGGDIVLYDYNPDRIPVGLPTHPDIYPNYKILDPGPGTKDQQLATLSARRDSAMSLVDREMLNETMYRIRGGHVAAVKTTDPWSSKKAQTKAILSEAFLEMGMYDPFQDDVFENLVTQAGSVKYTNIPLFDMKPILAKKSDRMKYLARAKERFNISKEEILTKTPAQIIADKIHTAMLERISILENMNNNGELPATQVAGLINRIDNLTTRVTPRTVMIHPELMGQISTRNLEETYNSQLPPGSPIGDKFAFLPYQDRFKFAVDFYLDKFVPFNGWDKGEGFIAIAHQQTTGLIPHIKHAFNTYATGDDSALLSKAEHHDVNFEDHVINDVFAQELLDSPAPDRGRAIFLRDSPFEDHFLMSYGQTHQSNSEDGVSTEKITANDFKAGDKITVTFDTGIPIEGNEQEYQHKTIKGIVLNVVKDKELGRAALAFMGPDKDILTTSMSLDTPAIRTNRKFQVADEDFWKNWQVGERISIKNVDHWNNHFTTTPFKTEPNNIAEGGEYIVIQHTPHNGRTTLRKLGTYSEFTFFINTKHVPDTSNPTTFDNTVAYIVDDVAPIEVRSEDVPFLHRTKVDATQQDRVIDTLVEAGAEVKPSTWRSTTGVGNQNSWAKGTINLAETAGTGYHLDLGDGKSIEYTPDVEAFSSISPDQINATTLIKKQIEKLANRNLVMINVIEKDNTKVEWNQSIPAVFDIDSGEVVQIMRIEEGMTNYQPMLVSKLLGTVPLKDSNLSTSVITTVYDTSYRMRKGLGLFKTRADILDYYAKQLEESETRLKIQKNLLPVLEAQGLTVKQIGGKIVPEHIKVMNKPSISYLDYAKTLQGGDIGTVSADPTSGFRHHLPTERRRFVMRGFKPHEATAAMKKLFGARVEDKIPAKHIFRSDRKMGFPLPLHNDYADGTLKPIIPDKFTISHVFGGDHRSIKSIVDTGGMISASEKMTRRPWGRWLPGGLSEVGDLGSGLSDHVFTVLGTNGYSANTAELFYKPVIAMRKGSLFSDKDFGGGNNRFDKYKRYMSKWGSKIEEGAPPEAILNSDRITVSSYYTHNAELNFKYELPHEDVGVIYINPSVSEKDKKAILAIKERYAPDAIVVFTRPAAREAARKMNIEYGFTNAQVKSMNDDWLQRMQVGSIIQHNNAFGKIVSIEHNGSSNWRDWEITYSILSGNTNPLTRVVLDQNENTHDEYNTTLIDSSKFQVIKL